MQLLLNTIMLEVNRWTADHQLTFPLIDLLEPIKKAGFDQLEIWQYHIAPLDRGELDELAGRLADLGLRARVLGAYPPLHLEGTEAEEARAELYRLVEAAAALGVSTFKIFPGRQASAALDPDTRSLSVDRLRELADELARHRMHLTMETHGNTLCDTLESTQELLDELASAENVGLCFQPYTEHDTDAAIAAFDHLKAAVPHIHLQNRRQTDNSTSLLEEGDWIDFRRFLPHVRQAGFDQLLCLEFTAGIFPPEGQPFDPQVVIDNAARDRDFIVEVWNG